jgi:hypothetical protein
LKSNKPVIVNHSLNEYFAVAKRSSMPQLTTSNKAPKPENSAPYYIMNNVPN